MKEPNGRVRWREIYRAAESGPRAFMTWPGFNNGICHKYACGECRNRECTGDHLTCNECPREWVQRTKERLERAQTKWADGTRGAEDGDPDLT